MPRCVVFRVDANPTIGLGHLMRCLALAQGFASANVKVVFVVLKESKQYCRARQDWTGELRCLPSSSIANEAKWLSDFCQDIGADWLILDGYHFDYEYRKPLNDELNCTSVKLGIFDDGQLCQTQLVEQNIALLINWASKAEGLPYEQFVPNARLCVGDDFRVLRQEFSAVIARQYESRDSLLLMFGGSDPSNLTLMLLRLFDSLSVGFPITVVTGGGYQRLPELQLFISTSELDITHHHDCQSIAQIMGEARLAVSAAGASQFELLSCSTPSILVTVAQNQHFASQQAKQQGWCEVVDYQQSDSALNTIAQITLNLWHQPEKLNTMHANASKYSSQPGIQRIIKELYLP